MTKEELREKFIEGFWDELSHVADLDRETIFNFFWAEIEKRDEELLAFKEWFNELPEESDDRLYITNETIDRFKQRNESIEEDYVHFEHKRRPTKDD